MIALDKSPQETVENFLGEQTDEVEDQVRKRKEKHLEFLLGESYYYLPFLSNLISSQWSALIKATQTARRSTILTPLHHIIWSLER